MSAELRTRVDQQQPGPGWDRTISCSVGLILHDATKQLLCLRSRAKRLWLALPEGSPCRVEAEALCELAADASDLTRSVVDVAKLASRMLKDDRTTVESALEASVARVTRIRGERTIALQVPVSLSARRIPGGAVSLLENLIDNAVLASSDESPVEVCVDELGSELSFLVSDRGVGMDHRAHPMPSDQEPDQAETRQGVGLLFARELVACVGGRIEFSSRNGGGTDALCIIPFLDDE